MFDALPETRGSRKTVAPRSFSTAVVAHGAVIAVIVITTFLSRVPAGADPPMPYLQPIQIDIPKGDNMHAGGGGPKPTPPPEAPKPPQTDKGPVQPQMKDLEIPEPPTPEIPEVAPTPDAPPVDQSDGSGGGNGGGKGTGTGGSIGPGDQDGTFGKPDGQGSEVPDHLLDEPYIIQGPVEAPVLIRRVEPEYPEIARRVRKEGNVILQAVVGTDGKVESVIVLRSEPLLDPAAIKAVSQWVYRPGVLHGRPVKVYITIYVTFRLD